MYYETKVINGIFHYRTTPSGEWIQCTLEELTTQILDLQQQLRNANEEIDLQQCLIGYPV